MKVITLNTELPSEYKEELKQILRRKTNALAELYGTPDDVWSDTDIESYIEDALDGWLDYYNDGYSAEDAIREDMTYWE